VRLVSRTGRLQQLGVDNMKRPYTLVALAVDVIG
jgi:hypothetical protein